MESSSQQNILKVHFFSSGAFDCEVLKMRWKGKFEHQHFMTTASVEDIYDQKVQNSSCGEIALSTVYTGWIVKAAAASVFCVRTGCARGRCCFVIRIIGIWHLSRIILFIWCLWNTSSINIIISLHWSFFPFQPVCYYFITIYIYIHHKILDCC